VNQAARWLFFWFLAFALSGAAMSVKVQRMANPEYLLKHDAEERLQTSSLAAALEPRWHGTGAEELELAVIPSHRTCTETSSGASPPMGNRKLVLNAGKETGQSVGIHRLADKSVSDLLCLSLKTNGQVIWCHREAVSAVVKKMERYCGVSRRAKAVLVGTGRLIVF